jgi:high-affinity Fe2+/Pb2+ permease
MSDTQSGPRIDVNTAVSIVIFASAVGGAFGYLFTVHLIESFASELEAVWLTTVIFIVAGLYLWGYLR